MDSGVRGHGEMSENTTVAGYSRPLSCYTGRFRPGGLNAGRTESDAVLP